MTAGRGSRRKSHDGGSATKSRKISDYGSQSQAVDGSTRTFRDWLSDSQKQVVI